MEAQKRIQALREAACALQEQEAGVVVELLALLIRDLSEAVGGEMWVVATIAAVPEGARTAGEQALLERFHRTQCLN